MADIQKAPVYPVELMIKQGEKETPELTIKDGNISFNLDCAIYVPKEFSITNLNSDNFIYFTILVDNDAISQRIGKLPLDPKYSLFKYDIPFNFSVSENTKSINLQAAYTNKHSGESGISESLRSGRFLNTFIPIEQVGINGK